MGFVELVASIGMRVWAFLGFIDGIQLTADMAHLASLVLLSKKIAISRSCKDAYPRKYKL